MSCFFRGPRHARLTALAVVLSLLTAGFARAEDEPIELMVNDADVVASIQVGKFLKSAAFKKLQTENPDIAAGLDKPMGKKTKLTPRQIESVFVSGNTAKQQFVAVLTMTTKIDEEDLKGDDGAEGTIEKVGDYEIHVDKDGKAHTLIDDNTVAMGPLETLKAVLKRDDDAEVSEDLDAAWEDVDDTKHVYVIATLGALMKQAAAGLPPNFPLAPGTLQKLEVATLTANAGDDLAIDLAVDCADEATAQQVKSLIDVIVNAQAGNPNAPPGVQAAAGSLKTSIEETTLNISAKVGFDLIMMSIKQQMGAGAAPPPQP